MVTFRAIASLTNRSDSWRMASLDIVGARGLRIISSITQQFQVAKPGARICNRDMPFDPEPDADVSIAGTVDPFGWGGGKESIRDKNCAALGPVGRPGDENLVRQQ
jgi:hypothetical protein